MNLLRLFLVVTFVTVTMLPRTEAQEVIYSAYEKFDYRNGEYSIVGNTGDLLYCYLNSPEGAVLQAFNDSMNKVATIILDFFPQKIYSTRFIAYSDRIIILYQALESNKVVQYAALLDDKARLVGRPIELGKVKPGIFGPMRSYFYSTISENKKSILVYSLEEKGGGIEFEGRWLDDSLKLLKRSKATFKANDRLTSGDVNIDNNGNVYLAAYTTTGMQDYADDFWMLSLAPGSNKFVPNQLKLSDKFAAGGYLKVDNINNKVYFGGFYSDQKNGGFNGVIYSSWDIASGNYDQIKFLPFDASLQQLVVGRKNHEFDNFMVRQLIVKNDGGFVLVSESSYITSRSTFMPGMGYYSTFYSPYSTTMVKEYHYGDILAISYNKEGVKEWNSVVPKDQYSQEDAAMFSSYVLLNSGGSLAFLFNDFNTSHSRIQLATLDATGKSQVNSFTAEGNDYPDWLPKAGKQVAARVLIVPCLHKRQICYAKVVF